MYELRHEYHVIKINSYLWRSGKFIQIFSTYDIHININFRLSMEINRNSKSHLRNLYHQFITLMVFQNGFFLVHLYLFQTSENAVKYSSEIPEPGYILSPNRLDCNPSKERKTTYMPVTASSKFNLSRMATLRHGTLIPRLRESGFHLS